MSIQFSCDDKDYNIKLVEGKKSDLTVVIRGVTYSVMTEAGQLDVVSKILKSLPLESVASIEDLSSRIGSFKGVSKTHTVGVATLHQAYSASKSEEKKRIAEMGVMRTVPIPGVPFKPITIEQRMQELNIPGTSITVIDQGEIQWTSGYGELVKPALVQAASISKTANALAVLSLIDQCREASKKSLPSGLVRDVVIDLDTDVSTLLEPDLWHSIDPDGMLDARNPKMTIRELLSHTAGTNMDSFKGYPKLENIDKEIAILKDEITRLGGDTADSPSSNLIARSGRLERLEGERFKLVDQKIPSLDGILRGEGNSEQVKVVAMPGTQSSYSGGGTTILQKVVEVVTGKSFENVVQERVFDKLGMKDSTYHPEKIPPSQGHEMDGSVIPGGFHVYPELAAAGLWTTSLDIANMALGIQGSLLGKEGSILSSELANTMLTPQTQGDNNGLGVFIGTTPDSKYFYHHGSTAGFKCLFVSNLEGQGAVVMTNGDFGQILYNDVIPSIAKAYHWPDATNLPVVSKGLAPDEIEAMDTPIDREKWKGTVGKYQFQEYFVEISLLGDKTFATVDEGSRFELIPITDNVGCYQSPEVGVGVARFQRAGDVVTGLNFFGVDHKRVESE